MEQDPLLQEVQEDVRRERLEALWNAYKRYILAVIVLVVGGIGGWQFIAYSQEQARQEQALAYKNALEQAQTADPMTLAPLEAIATEDVQAYAAFATLQQAGAMQSKGEPQAAYQAYIGLANDQGKEDAFRELALLHAGYLAFEKAAEASWQDEVKAQVQARLEEQDEAVYAGLLLEWLGLYHWRQGEMAEARQALEAILSDYQSPGHLVQRAEKMLSQIAPEEAETEGVEAETPDA